MRVKAIIYVEWVATVLKSNPTQMKTQLIFISVMFISQLALGQPQPYLKEVLGNLTKIKSASYYTTEEAWAPGDTIASGIYHHYVKEYNNPADTTIGAAFAKLMKDDTTRAVYSYNGKIRAVINWEGKQMQIDSFQNNRLPFRPIQAPFFNYVTSIIRYALDKKDQIQIKTKDLGSSIYLEIVIEGAKQVEFFGKPFYNDSPYSDTEISRYELWISTSNDLPYRVRREMQHDITVITSENIKANYQDVEDFLISDYLPADFAINQGRPISAHNSLTGKVAPAWRLTNANEETIDLKALKGKVLLIQFTSVSCGPCRLSVSFLNELMAEYDGSGTLDLIAIESFNRNSKVLEIYERKAGINYPFLLSTAEVTESYEIKLVPTFFLIDSRKVIRKVIAGYQKGATDRQIRDAIKELL